MRENRIESDRDDQLGRQYDTPSSMAWEANVWRVL
jgi:hypothetical protein